MKISTTLLIASLGLVALSAGGQTKLPSMITFRVIDDLGVAVTEGEVMLATFSHWVPGEGFGRDEYDQRRAPLTKDGQLSFAVPNIRGDLEYNVYPDRKYYAVTMQSYRFKQVRDGHWEPWNPEVTVVVPRVINPIPLRVRRVGDGPDLEMPYLGPVGFDLEISDWVIPFGRGKRSDLIFARKTIVPATDPAKAFESVFTVTFSNSGDGIQSRLSPPKRRLFDLPREAPEEGYEARLVKRVARAAEGAALTNDTREDENYFFRVRTVIDSNGKVISALYGKIHGDIQFFATGSPNGMVRFTYYLNPKDLDRNLEFDPKRNLFPQLLDGTNITEP